MRQGLRRSSRPTSRPWSMCCARIKRWSTTLLAGWSSWVTACPSRFPAFAWASAAILCGCQALRLPQLPEDLYVKPGTSIANRAALAKWGAWINTFGARTTIGRSSWRPRPTWRTRPTSADLPRATAISRLRLVRALRHAEGALLPQEITEFANIGMLVGAATVNFADEPEKAFDGFWGACSTYGSFSYLKYGMLRLFSQLSQDCQLRTGKVVYVAGHSGPETADDSRTHFGVFSPAVMQLFPAGHVINLHPWEYNEVPVLLGAALQQKAPIVVLHLTRPPITVPDRSASAWPHTSMPRGEPTWCATFSRASRRGCADRPGTSSMVAITRILPALDQQGLNVKIVYGASAELFALQPSRTAAGFSQQAIGWTRP